MFGTLRGCKACVEAGFSSIMFDGSHFSIEENVEKTKELVALAHAWYDIEADIGSIGGVEDAWRCRRWRDCRSRRSAQKITASIDFLGCRGIGNIHGNIYPANWKEPTSRLWTASTRPLNNIPLVPPRWHRHP